MGLRCVQCLAIMLTALALVPAGAHLAALPNKIGLGQEEYFIAQGIYRGWALFGFALFGAVFANLAVAIMVRRRRAAVRLALAACLLVIASLAVFFGWTYPANQATANWTVVPESWQALRVQWEYAHAAGAVLTLLALGAVTASALAIRSRAAIGARAVASGGQRRARENFRLPPAQARGPDAARAIPRAIRKCPSTDPGGLAWRPPRSRRSGRSRGRRRAPNRY
jgi:hypothetical protein